jgi:hypothetical protein
LTIEEEIERFDSEIAMMRKFIADLANVEVREAGLESQFLAEAVIFRLYRVFERLARASVLNSCVVKETLSGSIIKSRLKCDNWNSAEEILKSGNRFLDWGNVETVRKIANLVLENGFPVVDVVSPFASKLTDLQRFRNYVAHDSREAATAFNKSITQYVRAGDIAPKTVGELCIYKRNARADITLKLIHDNVSNLSKVLRDI